MNNAGATVFVVDDDISVRTGLSRLIRSAGWAVEMIGSAPEFLERAPNVKIGCVVLDVHMPNMSGPELYDRMKEAGIFFPVVFLTGKGEISTGVDVMKKGAIDYLLKPVDDEVLLTAIDQAIDRHVAESTHENAKANVLSKFSHLSLREREVLYLVLNGRLNKQIGGDLGIAEKTVKVHRGRVMEKMQVRSVAALVHLCEMAGIHAPYTTIN